MEISRFESVFACIKDQDEEGNIGAMFKRIFFKDSSIVNLRKVRKAKLDLSVKYFLWVKVDRFQFH